MLTGMIQQNSFTALMSAVSFSSYTDVQFEEQKLQFSLFIQVYVPQVLELIEMSPVNSDLQLGALRLLTNLSVTDKHQHLLKGSITLLLSLLVVSNEPLQVGLLCSVSFLRIFIK